MPEAIDTICAIATPAGKGGVSIVRVSGPATQTISKHILGKQPQPRYAHYGHFLDSDKRILDIGIALFFPGPDSFTGEDILELQAHGGPVIVDMLLQEVLDQGARLARPGEFSERAFLNDKIDLTQAEAIADLIDCHSREAVKTALNSLQGEFSKLVHALVESITELRIYVEAAIDFPEEEVDFLDNGNVLSRIESCLSSLDAIFAQAKQGSILKEGIKVVIAGEPNAGKSSLLNALSGHERAIVTDIPGTTRDTLREHILVHGIPIHIIDTAGLRESTDQVEQEGIKRAWQEVDSADLVLLVQDSTKEIDSTLLNDFSLRLGSLEKVIIVLNKIDLINQDATSILQKETGLRKVYLSAKSNQGINLLQDLLRDSAGLETSIEGGFIARRRHLDALTRAKDSLLAAIEQMLNDKAGELVAEDLLHAQQALSEITGEFSSDDLLGKIFSSFCIGK